MIPMLASTLFAAGFGVITNHARRRGANLYAVGAISYFISALLFVGLNGASGVWRPAPGTWVIAILCAIAYIAGFLVLFPVLAHRGVSISAAMQRMAVIMPLAVGLIWWGEHLAWLQAIGVGLVLVSLPLLTLHKSDGQGRVSLRDALLMLGLFVANGCGMVACSAFVHLRIEGQTLLFQALLFVASGLITALFWVGKHRSTRLNDLGLGIALGIDNGLANLTIMMALEQLPGALVFPCYSALSIIVSMTLARLFWRERISRQELAGIGLAVTAVVLANL